MAKKKRSIISQLPLSKRRLIIIGLATLTVASIVQLRSQPKPNYSQLLHTIAKGESSDNYNAYFGHPKNKDNPRFTSMTVDEVLAWQQDFTNSGSPSSAVGKYQFIHSTLSELVDQNKIDRQDLFSPSLQDYLAIKLIERRGVNDYMRGRISRDDFAHNLSKEWAALPSITGDEPSRSYYAGDGLNKSRISPEEILASISALSL